MKILIKPAYQYMVVFFNFSPTSNHLHPLQVENCDSNSRLVVDDDDNGKCRYENAKHQSCRAKKKQLYSIKLTHHYIFFGSCIYIFIYILGFIFTNIYNNCTNMQL